MTPALHSLSHVALETPDLEESLYCFEEAIGFEVVERSGGTVYLRAPDEFSHHSLSLAEADETGVDHIGWQAADEASVAGFADALEGEGIDVTWVEAGEEAGQGEAIRFSTPTGHRFEIFYHLESPDAPEEKRSKLRNKPYADVETNPVAPRRIDHVQIWDGDALELARWMCEHLGFRVQESWDNADGSRWGTFISANGVKIEAAVVQDPDEDAPPKLNHIAYKVGNNEDIFAAAGAMREKEIPVDGFGQHAISRGSFCYARDPVSDHTIEFNGAGYLVFDPEWEPVRWQEGDLIDRQWAGQHDGSVSVPY
ncbi:MAG: VOC family protein [Halobacteriales archaeon]